MNKLLKQKIFFKILNLSKSLNLINKIKLVNNNQNQMN